MYGSSFNRSSIRTMGENPYWEMEQLLQCGHSSYHHNISLLSPNNGISDCLYRMLYRYRMEVDSFSNAENRSHIVDSLTAPTAVTRW